MKKTAIWVLSILIISLIVIRHIPYAADNEIVVVKHRVVSKKQANTFVLVAEGKIKNVGKSAVKNVIIAAECDECVSGNSKWRVSESGYKIDFLPSGDIEDFKFDIAVKYSFYQDVLPPDPVGLKIKIVSFDEI